jgi:hypothetical protein
MNNQEMLQFLLENFNRWEDVDIEEDSYGGWYISSVGDHNAIEVQHDTLGCIDEYQFNRYRHTVPLKQFCVNFTLTKSSEETTKTHRFDTEQQKNAFLFGIEVAVGYEFLKINKTYIE